uniref:Kinesin-like protein n=1 Tax=Cacopsylla melanoneura TaxID=428564 RepID=A0A8D9BAF2_9HEMI
MSSRNNPRALFSSTPVSETPPTPQTPKSQTKSKEKFVRPATPKTPLAAANYERCIQARRAMSVDRSPATPKFKAPRPGNPITRSSSENCVAENMECSRMTVAVRIRPLLVKELHMPVSSIDISSDGRELVVNDNLKKYTFKLDHCLSQETSQEAVFSIIAQPLLDAAFNGYNVCLFAYGQTGSGKSYSMMGDNLDSSLKDTAGIIPRFCHQLFDQIPSNMVAQVKISYLEIYNEFVYDLLSSDRKALKVRESPETGIFVSDLSVHGVSSFAEMQKWLSEGNKARVTASTNMNDKSSRSHSIFQIQLTLTEDTGSSITQKCSQINLVDLAGSERVAQTKATEERFKEGRNINLSLMTLGQVITNLADHSAIPPYRNSTLTYLLKDCLGGNSRTTMLATINPLQSHIEESLATLRYALQARNIVNTIRKNQDCKETCLRCQNMGLLENLKFKEWHTKISEAELETRRKNEYICNIKFENEQLLKQNEYKTKQLLEFEQELKDTMKLKDDKLVELANIARTREQELVSQRKEALQSVQKAESCQQQLDKIKEEFKELQERYQRDLNKKSETISSLMNEKLAMQVKYEEEIDRKNAKIREMMTDSTDVHETVGKKDAEIERLLEENEKLSMDLVCKENEEMTQLMQELEKKDNYIQNLLKENETNIKLCKELEKQVHELNLNKELDRLNHEIVHKDDEIRQNVKVIKQLENEMASQDDTIKKLIKQNNDLVQNVTSLERENEKLKTEIESERKRVQKLSKQNENTDKHEKKIELEEVNNEIKRLEELVKENECERAGLLTKEKRREEEIKRLKEEVNKYKEEVQKHKETEEHREEMLKQMADYEQMTKDLTYYENIKDKLEEQMEKLTAESAEKIKLRDNELDKKHEAIAAMKLIMEQNSNTICDLKAQLTHERALIKEQEMDIKGILDTLQRPTEPALANMTEYRRDFMKTLDTILGLTLES